MTKSNKQIHSDHYKKRKEAGFVRVNFWVHKDNVKEFRNTVKIMLADDDVRRLGQIQTKDPEDGG